MKTKIGIDEILYYFSFGLMFMAKGIGLDGGQKLFSICMSLALILIILKIGVTKYNIKEWGIIIGLLLIGVMIWKSSGEKAAIWSMLFIVGMKNIPIRRLMRVNLGIWSVSFLGSLVMGLLHIRDGVVVVHEKLGLGPVIRWSLGYTHPNVLHISYLILVMLLIYVFQWHGRKLYKISLILMLGNFVVFLYSISYTGVLIVTGYIVLTLYFEYRKKTSVFDAIILSIIVILLIAFPILGPLWLNVHNHKLFMFFNELLSYRFELVWNIFAEYPISLFGTKTVFTGNAHLTLDSSFAYLLMYYGIVGFILFVSAFVYLVFYFAKNNRKYELAITLTIITAGVTEQFLFNLSFKNLLFFFLGEVLFLHTDKRIKKGKQQEWSFSVVPIQWSIYLKERGLFLKSIKYLKKYINKLIVMAAISAALGAVCSMIFVKKPESVYVYRWLTDYRGEDKVYLDMGNLPDDFNSLVIGYNGPDAEMFEFSGNIVKIERVRTTVGGIFLGGVSGMFFGMVYYGLKKVGGEKV